MRQGFLDDGVHEAQVGIGRMVRGWVLMGGIGVVAGSGVGGGVGGRRGWGVSVGFGVELSHCLVRNRT